MTTPPLSSANHSAGDIERALERTLGSGRCPRSGPRQISRCAAGGGRRQGVRARRWLSPAGGCRDLDVLLCVRHDAGDAAHALRVRAREYLPRALARVSATSHVPVVAIVTHAALACALAVTGSFLKLVVYANIMALVLSLFCCVAAFELRRRDIRAGGMPSRVPGGALVPFLAVVLISYLLTTATAGERSAVGAAMAGATLLYFARAAAAGRPVPRA